MYKLNKIFTALITTLLLISFCFGQTPSDTRKWYKGNTHTHTTNSDGDSAPDAVVKWYSDNRYNFVFITDHEFITPVATLNDLYAKPGEFLVIQGQEITDSLNNKPHHINALGIGSVIRPQKGTTVTENYQKNVDMVRAAGGIPQINHPNFGWAATARDLEKVQNVTLMEVHNGHPLVNNLGGGGSPGAEEIWDTLLSSGKVVYGIADDDSHHFKRPGVRTSPLPGQAWVFVRASDLTAAEIMTSLDRGDFYASTGVEMANYQADGKSISISIREERSSKYRVEFIGRGGRILQTSIANPATYKIRGNEGYVRAKIFESNGKLAWTQPVFVGKRK